MIIRKISIGPNVLDGNMVYTVGQTIRSNNLTITEIIREDDGSTKIYGEKDGVKFVWKETNNSVPVTLEYNTDL